MTPLPSATPIGPDHERRGWIAFYRLQARLMWDWRPPRLALLRRSVLSFLGACLALAVADAVLPDLTIDGLGPLLLAGLLLLIMDGSLAVVRHGLLVGWPIVVSQALGVVVQFAAVVTLDAIEEFHPGLVEGLAHHPGVGALAGRTAAGHMLVSGADGWRDLDDGTGEGVDPLVAYGPGAIDALRRLDAFPEVGDLVLLGAIDAVTGDVTAFEELIGSNGGLGGPQTEPFILCPSSLQLAEHPPVGAPALFRQLTAWLAQLRREPAVADAPSPWKEAA